MEEQGTTLQQPIAMPENSTKSEDEEKVKEPVYEATMECRYYAPGQLVCALGSPGAAHFIEYGVLEAFFAKSYDVRIRATRKCHGARIQATSCNHLRF